MPLEIQVGPSREVTRAGLREPQLLRLPDGDLLLTYHVQADMHFSERLGLRSRDAGVTWQPEPRRAHREQAIGQSRAGVVLAPDVYTFEQEPGHYLGSLYRSTDGGQTFTGPHDTHVHVNRIASQGYPTEPHFPPEDHVLRKFYQPLPDYYAPLVARSSRRWGPSFHRNLLERDGRWLTAMQCRFHGDGHYRTILVESHDEGANWSFVSTIAQVGNRPEPPGDGYCEPALRFAADGTLLCVLRRGGGLPLGQTRSTDHGQTWEDVELLAGHGVDPELCLLSNGVMVCSFGRPGLHLMCSEDGCGYGWGYHRQLGAWPSSSYMSMVEIGPDELLLVYDRAEDSPGAGRDPARCHLGCMNITIRRTTLPPHAAANGNQQP